MSHDYEDYEPDDRPRRRPEAAEDYDRRPVDEQAQEADDARKYITVAFRGEPIRVLPDGVWPLSGVRAIRTGDFDTALPLLLHPDDAEYIFDADPAMDEFNEFMQDIGKLASRGKARGPQPSSKRTPRR